MDVIVIGGGWGGVAAALEAASLKAETLLLERTDMLLGTGLVGGIMRNNGRFTAAEEMICLGGGKLFSLIDENLRHRNISFPGHEHACLYDVTLLPPKVKPFLEAHGVKVQLGVRINGACARNGLVSSIYDDGGHSYHADIYIDATGTAGPPASCTRFGNGCAMCALRCPAFGGRKSICSDMGILEYANTRQNGAGAFSGSCELLKESLSEDIIKVLSREGKLVVPIPEELKHDLLSFKACRQYALEEYRDNAVLLDNGHAKLMTPYFPLEELRRIPGFERAVYADPLAGGRGNSVRFTAMAPRDNYMKSETVGNLFFAGEKAGPLVGHTEAIVTGTLAGYNAVRTLCGKSPAAITEQLASGYGISYSDRRRREDSSARFTFSGGELFERLKEKGMYLTDKQEIYDRVNKLGLLNMFGNMEL